MNSIEEVDEFVRNGYKTFMPHFSIECVIFGYENKHLKVLICKWIGTMGWGLPSGYVKREEGLTDAANRILKERTAIDNVFLKQFNFFGDSIYRRAPYIMESAKGLPEGNWLSERTVSFGYYALLDCSKAIIKQDYLFEEYKWVDVEEIPELLLDNNEIINTALRTLRIQIFHEPIGFELLPEKFTLPEIQALYETILDKKLHRRNFPQKLLSLKLIIKLDEKRSIGQHRSPFLYKFHNQNYKSALDEGLVLTL